MIILNFSHAMVDEQVEQVRKILKKEEDWDLRIFQIRCRPAIERPLIPQINKIMKRIPLRENEWSDEEILVIPPPVSHVALLVVLAISKKMLEFPRIIRIKRDLSAVDKYVVAEIYDLN